MVSRGFPTSLISWADLRNLAADRAADHELRLQRVAGQLRARAERGVTTPVSLRKRAVSHVVPKRDDLRHSDEKIDIGDLDFILDIDPSSRTCTAEPGVTFAALVKETLQWRFAVRTCRSRARMGASPSATTRIARATSRSSLAPPPPTASRASRTGGTATCSRSTG
jgi:hypothetical protein